MSNKNSNLDLYSIYAYTKFYELMSISSKDIELKGYSDITEGP